MTGYRGRFAPSPTGLLHAGSLVAALASWLDARAHQGRWLVRMEDLDTPRCVPGADRLILQQLSHCGLTPDEPPVWQSCRTPVYQAALDKLIAHGLAYPCACSRADIEAERQRLGQHKTRHGELIYPGTCRHHGLRGKPARAWRFLTPLSDTNSITVWSDRRLGPQSQNVGKEVGDFVLKRADGIFAYQLAVVVDDAAQSISHIVRGADLVDNTARQILLQQALRQPTPQYLHSALVLGPHGEKLSKQNGAQPLDTHDPLQALNAAAQVLGFRVQASTLGDWLAQATARWSDTDAQLQLSSQGQVTTLISRTFE
jgi:glutamyl-Q tRNA(Asp) synthetase